MADRTRIACFLLALFAVFWGGSTFAAAPPARELGPLLPPELAKAVMPPVYLGDDLARVPEVVFETPPAEKLSTEQWKTHTARMLSITGDLNSRQRDGFVKALVQERRDLAGLPFLMGDDCRRNWDSATALQKTVKWLRDAGESSRKMRKALREVTSILRESNAYADEAEVAAVTQIMGARDAGLRLGLVSHLAEARHPRATTDLAQVAIFDLDKKVRGVALKALAGRPRGDYTPVLVKALRYPWPAVAQNAAEAIVQLRRKDLLPQLVDLLDEPDPRAAQREKIGDREMYATREVVRINHHKSCLLCHASARTEEVRKNPGLFFLTEVPLPTEPLDSRGYLRPPRKPRPELKVCIDVTYLRQDFSVLQPVKNARPWPEMQRFDYLVRKRVLSDKEAADLKARLNAGGLSPYQKAAVRALRALTGRCAP
jgi:hypothetical protein